MRKIYSAYGLLFIALVFSVAGCKKDKTGSSDAIDPESKLTENAAATSCKLMMENMHHSFWQTYAYNRDNKVDKWVSSFGNGVNYITKIDYHPDGKLKRADVHISGSSFKEYANFIYQNGRIIKVEWRYTNTDELDYELLVSYNAAGQISKLDVPAWNFYYAYDYNSIDRNVIRTNVFVDNFRVDYIEYVYTQYVPGCYMPLLDAGLPFDFLSPWIHDFPQFPTGTNVYGWNNATNSYDLYYKLLPQNTTFSLNNSGLLENITRTDEFSGEVVRADYGYTGCGNANGQYYLYFRIYFSLLVVL